MTSPEIAGAWSLVLNIFKKKVPVSSAVLADLTMRMMVIFPLPFSLKAFNARTSKAQNIIE